MFNKKDVELIILEVLGCLDETDKRNLRFLRENDESFSWKELGECQNISALLPSLIKVENPSVEPKEIIVRKLNKLLFGKEDVGQTEKYVPGKQDADKSNLKEIPDKNKIDWESLSVSGSATQQRSGFKEVKPKNASSKRELTYSDESENISVYEESELEEINESQFSEEKNLDKSSSLKKYILTSILLFVAIVSISAYLFLNIKNETLQVVEEKKLFDTPVITTVEEFSYDSVKGIEPIVEISEMPEVKIINKPQTEKSVLPKAPPKLPEPIETPVVLAQDVLKKEELIVEQKISVPPPKEINEETEEPTYFVAVEEMPQPIGGLQTIQGRISYPEIAKRVGIEGKVFVRAFVDETGKVVNAEVVKGIGGGCDEAALDAILKTNFTPGKQRGKPIKVQVMVPVLFKL